MTRLSHAEAHELLADLALDPGAFDRLGPADSDPLSAHVAGCAACRANVEAWRRTQARLADARGPVHDRTDLADLAVDEPIAAPDGLRDAVLAAIHSGEAPSAAPATPLPPVVSAPLARASGGRRWRPMAPLGRPALALVAVLAIAVVGGGVFVDQAIRLDQARQDTAALESVTATVDRILRDPQHSVVDLRAPEGQVEGSLSWSSHDIVVLTTALEPPPAGREYRCWIERNGSRSRVGTMWFAAGTAFWSGSLDEWATTTIEAGGTFGVSLEPTDAPGGNPAVLAADLGS